MTTTLTIFYVRRDTAPHYRMWCERKTFASIIDEFKYESMLQDMHKYAIMSRFDSLQIFVNVECKED